MDVSALEVCVEAGRIGPMKVTGGVWKRCTIEIKTGGRNEECTVGVSVAETSDKQEKERMRLAAIGKDERRRVLVEWSKEEGERRER